MHPCSFIDCIRCASTAEREHRRATTRTFVEFNCTREDILVPTNVVFLDFMNITTINFVFISYLTRIYYYKCESL